MGKVKIEFDDPSKVPQSDQLSIRKSIEAYNEEKIVGSVSAPTTTELKRRFRKLKML